MHMQVSDQKSNTANRPFSLWLTAHIYKSSVLPEQKPASRFHSLTFLSAMSSANDFVDCGTAGSTAGSSKCLRALAAPVMNVPTQNIARRPPAATPTAKVAADRWQGTGAGNDSTKQQPQQLYL